MHDNADAHNDRNDLGQNLPHRDAARDRATASRPLADREVPLPGLAAADDPSMVAIHQWLDGDLAESDARRVDAKQVDMWKQVANETDRRRRMVTPSYVAANIMNALPTTQLLTNLATTTTATSTTGVSTTTVMMIGAAMLALGVVIGRML